MYAMVQPKNHAAAFFFFLINALMASIISNKGNPTIISSGINIIDPVLNCSICIAILVHTIDAYSRCQKLYPK